MKPIHISSFRLSRPHSAPLREGGGAERRGEYSVRNLGTRAFALLVAFAATATFAQGPGGGGGGTFSYDAFLSVTTNANCLIREGTLYGATSSLTTSVAPTSAGGVTALADGVFAGNTTIRTVNLANTSIEAIPDSAFAGCTALTTVALPATCTTIGPNAFAGCTALSTFTGAGVSTIGADAFRGCAALAAVPSSATTLGAYAFARSGVKAADLSSATAGEGAFAGCEGLTAATVATSASLPAALFAGCTALDVSDWSGVATFGQASLAGIPATTLALDPDATLGAYALAADEATLVTTLSGSSVPARDATAFLGREVSYTVSDGVLARIEAEALVNWLGEQAADATSTVAQPASYATADLETWLATASNAGSILLFGYEEEYAADAGYLALDVSGTNFLWTAQDAATAESVAITLEGSYALGDDASWSADNLVYDADTDTYVAADPDEPACFARLRLEKGW